MSPFPGGSKSCKLLTCSRIGRARIQTHYRGDKDDDDEVTTRKICSRESWSSTCITMGLQALAHLWPCFMHFLLLLCSGHKQLLSFPCMCQAYCHLRNFAVAIPSHECSSVYSSWPHPSWFSLILNSLQKPLLTPYPKYFPLSPSHTPSHYSISCGGFS